MNYEEILAQLFIEDDSFYELIMSLCTLDDDGNVVNIDIEYAKNFLEYLKEKTYNSRLEDPKFDGNFGMTEGPNFDEYFNLTVDEQAAFRKCLKKLISLCTAPVTSVDDKEIEYLDSIWKYLNKERFVRYFEYINNPSFRNTDIVNLVCKNEPIAQNTAFTNVSLCRQVIKRGLAKEALRRIVNTCNDAYVRDRAESILINGFAKKKEVPAQLKPADNKDGINNLLILSEQGDLAAQIKLAECYEYGDGVEKDFKKAFFWFEKAADHGDSYSQYNLGYFYKYGEGVEKDYNKAFFWYEKSAKQGDSYAQNSLGNLYKYGEGVEKDLSKAAYWYEKSAEQGNSYAQNNLGYCYLSGEGVNQDKSKAFFWFSKSAEQGDSESQFWIANCYRYGEGVEQDLSKAVYWYTKSAEQGDSYAQNSLGKLYKDGEGVEKDFKKAFFWFEKSAEQNNSEAQYWLSICYEDGKGVEQDKAKSGELLEQAVSSGNEYAIEKYKEKMATKIIADRSYADDFYDDSYHFYPKGECSYVPALKKGMLKFESTNPPPKSGTVNLFIFEEKNGKILKWCWSPVK